VNKNNLEANEAEAKNFCKKIIQKLFFFKNKKFHAHAHSFKKYFITKKFPQNTTLKHR
jgi:hypothetical protein